jgi:hypothetical protein
VDLPKGILLVGLPGCGKSLAARVAAGVLDLPLLRLDMGGLMGKYLGESEERLSRALASVEASAPCVLWIDEIEKALGGAGEGSGTSTDSRMFARMLTWMQEQDLGVYLIATANAVEKLPPELLRRGRFDESFFVGLPNTDERAEIVGIHLKRRGLEHDDALPSKVAKFTKGFSGAEIEALVKTVHRYRFVQRPESDLLTDLERFAGTMTPFSRQWADKMDVMERPLKKQGFRNASSDGKGPRLDPVKQRDLPEPLLALMRSRHPVVIRPRKRKGSSGPNVVWTMECTPGSSHLDVRFTTGAHTRVPTDVAEAVARLVPRRGTLTGKFSSEVVLSKKSRAETWTLGVEGGEVVGYFNDDASRAAPIEREFVPEHDPTLQVLAPELFPLLGGRYEVEVDGVRMVFRGEGDERVARCTSKEHGSKEYRVRVRGAHVHLHGIDDASVAGLEISWKKALVLRWRSPAKDERPPEDSSTRRRNEAPSKRAEKALSFRILGVLRKGEKKIFVRVGTSTKNLKRNELFSVTRGQTEVGTVSIGRVEERSSRDGSHVWLHTKSFMRLQEGDRLTRIDESGGRARVNIVKIKSQRRDGVSMQLQVMQGRLKKGNRLSVVRRGGQRVGVVVVVDRVTKSTGGMLDVDLLYEDKQMSRIGFRKSDVLVSS